MRRTTGPEAQAAKDGLARIYKAATRLRWAALDDDEPLADLLYSVSREASAEVARLIMTRDMREDDAAAAVVDQPPYREAERLAARILEEARTPRPVRTETAPPSA